MIEELYDRVETDTSKDELMILSENLPKPIVILGGWAVYLTVNELFEEENGSTYLGSRDVDVGFHIDLEISQEKLSETNFAKAQEILRSIGYIPIGTSRFCKIIHRITKKVLSEEEAGLIPPYDLFYLYVDPIVDQIHPNHYEIFSIKPIDEPILARAFKDNLFTKIRIDGVEILLPKPHILIATKLKAYPDREKEDKKIKDACDLYALLWYSPIDFRDLVFIMKTEYSELCNNVKEILQNTIANKAARHLGIESETFIGVLEQLVI